MKFKGTWIFTIVVIVAVGTAIWDYNRQKAMDTEKETAAYLLKDFQMSNVVSLEFIGNAGSFKAKNESGNWQITEPIQDKADYESLEGLLLGLAEQGMAELTLEGDVNWAQYGLDQPEATLLLLMQDGSNIKVEVGSQRAYNDGYYVRKNTQNKLFLGSTSWTSYLSKSANDMRNRDLYFGSSDNNFVEIKQAKKKLSFSMKDGKWVSQEQPNILVDESPIYDYFNLIRHLRADAVVSDVANKAARKLYNLNRPDLVITTEEKGQEEHKKWKIEFSKEKNGEVFVSVGADRPVYRIQSRKMESLKKDFAHFRDKAYPFAFNQPQVPGFRIKRAEDKKELSFYKKSGKWQLSVEEPHMKVNELAITNLFNDLRGLKVKEFIAGSGAKESLRGKYGFVVMNALGEAIYEIFWSDEEKVKEDARVKVWTSLSKESFWVDANEFKKFVAHNLLVPDTSMNKEKEGK